MKNLDDINYTISLLKSLTESKKDYLEDLHGTKYIEYEFKRLEERLYNFELMTYDLLESLQNNIENIQNKELEERRK